MFYLDNRTKYKFTQYDGYHPDAQVMDDKKMLHLAKSSTVSVRFQPEILNGNLSILYVVSPFTIINNLSQLSSIHSSTIILNGYPSILQALCREQNIHNHLHEKTMFETIHNFLHENTMFTMLRRCSLTTYLFIATTLPTPPPPHKQCGSGICCDI